MEAFVVHFRVLSQKKNRIGTSDLRLDFHRSLVSGPRPSPSGEGRGLLFQTVAGDQAYSDLKGEKN